MYAKTLESFSSKNLSNRNNHDNRNSDHSKTANIQILTNSNRQKSKNDANVCPQNPGNSGNPVQPKTVSPPAKKNASPVSTKNISPTQKKGSPNALKSSAQNQMTVNKPVNEQKKPETKQEDKGEHQELPTNQTRSRIETQNQENKPTLHDTVNKFNKDGKGSSRHVLMLQQQLYQEDQQQHDYQGRRQYNYHGRSYSPPPYSSWSTYDYHEPPHDMTFDSSYTPYQHFGNTNYDYRPYSSYGAGNNYGNQYSCCYRGGNSWNQYNNQYRSQRPPPQCSPPNCTTMYSTVVQQKWSHRCSPYEILDDSSSVQRQSPVNMFRPITTPPPVPGTCSPAVEEEELEWDGIVGPVELLVSNLDYNISAKEWRKILFTTFHPHVRVSITSHNGCK